MAIIQISYYLNQPGREYGPLITRIKELGGQNWCKALESHWFIKTGFSVTQVRDDLLRYIDQSSRLLVLIKRPKADRVLVSAALMLTATEVGRIGAPSISPPRAETTLA